MQRELLISAAGDARLPLDSPPPQTPPEGPILRPSAGRLPTLLPRRGRWLARHVSLATYMRRASTCRSTWRAAGASSRTWRRASAPAQHPTCTLPCLNVWHASPLNRADQPCCSNWCRPWTSSVLPAQPTPRSSLMSPPYCSSLARNGLMWWPSSTPASPSPPPATYASHCTHHRTRAGHTCALCARDGRAAHGSERRRVVAAAVRVPPLRRVVGGAGPRHRRQPRRARPSRPPPPKARVASTAVQSD